MAGYVFGRGPRVDYEQVYTYEPYRHDSSDTTATEIAPGPRPQRVRRVDVASIRPTPDRERREVSFDEYFHKYLHVSENIAKKMGIPIITSQQKREEAAAVSEPLLFDPANLVL